MSKIEENKFKFWCPIEKATEVIDPTTGEQLMKLGGIASTSDEDSDGEFLDPKGFDIKPLLESGMVNWHHQAKGQPATIIGEPSKAEIRPEGLYIETDLYPSSRIAKDVWELAETLEKDSKTRRLGYSIEGKVIKRKSDNKNSPDYKKILKAIITGVAITHQPKNPKTFANIIKGEIDEDYEDDEGMAEGYSVESIAKKHGVSVSKIKQQLKIGTKVEMEHTDDEDEACSIAMDHLVEFSDYYDRLKRMESKGDIKKDLNTNNGSALKKESVNKKIKNQTFSKSEVIERLFKDIPAISIEKAEKIHLMLINFAKMKGRKNVTNDDIQKAYEALGLDVEENDVEKGCDADGGQTQEKPITKAKSSTKKAEEAPESEDDTSEEAPEDDEEDDGAEEGGEVKKADGGNRFDRIEKAIASSHQINSKYIKALGVMIKDASQKLESAAARENELLDIVKAQDETISVLSEKIEQFGSEVPAPKSISSARPVERHFAKSNENDFGNEGSERSKTNQVSISRQKNVVAEILDQATFSKGFDDEFSKAVTHFEATKSLPSNIIARIKNEYGIEIVK